jgi:FtsH-binding integral membrane protein
MKEVPCTRRNMMLATGVSVIAPLVNRPSTASALPLWVSFVGRTAFAAAITWFVNRILDSSFGVTPTVEAATPIPSGGGLYRIHVKSGHSATCPEI